MLERLPLPNFRNTLFKIIGIPQHQVIDRLDRKLSAIERHLKNWAKKVGGEPLTSIKAKRVLLADTDTLSYEILRDALPENLELKMVRDWEQLFRETRKAAVPLVIIDLALLGQEGVQNIKKLKEENPELRVVTLANYLSESLAQAMPEAKDLAGVMQKPLDPLSLKENLNKYLS